MNLDEYGDVIERSGHLYLNGKPYAAEYHMGTFKSHNEEIRLILRGCEKHRVPHFHFKLLHSGVQGCIELYRAKYTSHRNHKGKLDNIYLDDLVKFLNRRDTVFKNKPNAPTVWREMRVFWNNALGTVNRPEHDNPIDIVMPDYTKLNES